MSDSKFGSEMAQKRQHYAIFFSLNANKISVTLFYLRQWHGGTKNGQRQGGTKNGQWQGGTKNGQCQGGTKHGQWHGWAKLWPNCPALSITYCLNPIEIKFIA